MNAKTAFRHTSYQRRNLDLPLIILAVYCIIIRCPAPK
jgi:hypothetical protein